MSADNPAVSPIDVSVVVPTRNRAVLAAEAIRSALAQRDVALEVLVVDDASDPETATALDALATEDSRVRILHLPLRRGVARARNTAIEQARGEHVAFLDDDDLWAPDHVRTHLEVAEREGADMTYGTRLVVDAQRRPLRAMLAELPDEMPELLRYGNTVGTPSCVVVRTALLRESGGFEPTLSALADWALWMRLAELGRLAPVGEALMAYTVHPGNMHRTDPFGVLEEFKRLRELTGWTIVREPFVYWLALELIQHGDRRRAAALFLNSARQSGGRRDYLRALAALAGLYDGLVGENDRPVAAPPWLRALAAEAETVA
jgi:glycosyltransferase involved in cell wall biosynthesis